MNWKKILETKAGAEFEKWIDTEVGYKLNDVQYFGSWSKEWQDRGNVVSDNIINYLVGYCFFP